MILTNFENLNSISNISQERTFLTFDRLSISNYFYLFKNHRQTFSWPGEGPSFHLKDKDTKMWFVKTLNTFRNPALRSFAAQKASLA